MTTLKPNIVVVDDNAGICDVLSKYLTKKNYTVTTFTSPNAALQSIKETDYHLMLVDLRMREMNGLEVIKTVKMLRPNLPVMVMTGFPEEKIMNELTKMGIPDYLQKPFDLNYLESIIVRKLGGGGGRNQRTISPCNHEY